MTLARELLSDLNDKVKPAPERKQRADSVRALRALATRQALVASGRVLFTDPGYFAVGVRDFAAHAGVTRGALYHHFGDKESLFLAVFNAVEEELIADQMRTATQEGGDPWHRLRNGIQTYLDAAMRPDVQRITLIDGPAVLGWAKWRQLEEGYSLGGMLLALKAAMDAKLIRARPLEPLAHVLLGSVMEAALLVAHCDNPSQRRAEVGAALDDLIRGLE